MRPARPVDEPSESAHSEDADEEARDDGLKAECGEGDSWNDGIQAASTNAIRHRASLGYR